MRATYLDNIQISTDEGIKNYKKGIFYSCVFIGVSYLIFKLLPSIYLLSMFPIFISIIGNIFLYKKNESHNRFYFIQFLLKSNLQ